MKWTREQLDEMKTLEGEALLRYMSEIIYNNNPEAFDYYTEASSVVSEEEWDALINRGSVEDMMEWFKEHPLVHVPTWNDLTEDQQADMMWRVQIAARRVQDERDSDGV